jgi:hypothetical protein
MRPLLLLMLVWPLFQDSRYEAILAPGTGRKPAFGHGPMAHPAAP